MRGGLLSLLLTPIFERTGTAYCCSHLVTKQKILFLMRLWGKHISVG